MSHDWRELMSWLIFPCSPSSLVLPARWLWSVMVGTRAPGRSGMVGQAPRVEGFQTTVGWESVVAAWWLLTPATRHRAWIGLYRSPTTPCPAVVWGGSSPSKEHLDGSKFLKAYKLPSLKLGKKEKSWTFYNYIFFLFSPQKYRRFKKLVSSQKVVIKKCFYFV